MRNDPNRTTNNKAYLTLGDLTYIQWSDVASEEAAKEVIAEDQPLFPSFKFEYRQISDIYRVYYWKPEFSK